ncbi:Protein of unknown function [Gryllus bimaculatus]|nr:Protein of unknown function [Gryllus bimaculatus]
MSAPGRLEGRRAPAPTARGLPGVVALLAARRSVCGGGPRRRPARRQACSRARRTTRRRRGVGPLPAPPLVFEARPARARCEEIRISMCGIGTHDVQPQH